MTSTVSSGREISRQVAKELEALRLNIIQFSAAQRLWTRVLTAKDRQRLGGNLNAWYTPGKGTAAMWMKLRGVSYERAVIEVAHKLGHLSESDMQWLLRETGEKAPRPTRRVRRPAARRARPRWERTTGTLRFGDRVIRRVRIMGVPTNIHMILDAFESLGWPPEIMNPISGDRQKVHQALRSLHKDLKKLRFHAQEGGRAIRWESS